MRRIFMIRKLIVAILILFLVQSNITYTYAEDLNVEESNLGVRVRRNPEELSAMEIMEDLYSEEQNSEIRRFAKDSTMVLTGEMAITNYWGNILIGTYNDQSVFYHSYIAAVVGEDDLLADISDGKYTMLFTMHDYPTTVKMNENKAAIRQLYETVWDIRENTALMTDQEKVIYIGTYLQEHLNIRPSVPGRIASRLKYNDGDCDVFSGLFYIAAINCELNVRAVTGSIDEPHAWNEVEINNEWLLVDVILNNYFLDEASATRYGYNPVYKTNQ